MKRLYEAPAYDTDTWPDSYWRWSVSGVPEYPALDGERRAEVAIIGAGFTGLNAALELAERYGTGAVVLEAGQPGWGASGRNGGFVCMGGAKISDAAILRRHGEAVARGFHDAQRAAIDRVAENLSRYAIAADTHSEGELCLAHRPRALSGLREEAELSERLFGLAIEILDRDALAERGLGPAGFHGGALKRAGFALNPMKYVLGLAAAARAAGQEIFGASPVTAIRPEGPGWRLATPGGQVTAPRVIVATNGYSSDDIPAALSGAVLPALSSVLVTRPLSGLDRAAQGWNTDLMCYDTRRLLHYFRLMPDGRFLFGMRGGLSAAPAATARIRATARRHFEALFPVWREVETPWFWSGLVALTRRLTPILAPTPAMAGVTLALGYHGNGVAMGSHAGRLAAALAMGEDQRPALLRASPARFPIPALRRAMLGAAYLGYGLADAAP